MEPEKDHNRTDLYNSFTSEGGMVWLRSCLASDDSYRYLMYSLIDIDNVWFNAVFNIILLSVLDLFNSQVGSRSSMPLVP